MKIIGLTGGSGSGKSAVAKIMRKLGAGSVDADSVYRQLCASNREMLDELDRAFGGVLTRSGALDRARLAGVVFGDPEKLRRLNEITFPYICEASLKKIQAQTDKPIVLLDAPTLFETGADKLCSDTVGIIADINVRLSRIMSRDGISHEAACSRIAAQPDESFYRQKCGHILINNGNLAGLRRDTDDLYKILIKGDVENET